MVDRATMSFKISTSIIRNGAVRVPLSNNLYHSGRCGRVDAPSESS